MTECPCRYCTERKVGCHGKCNKYKSWKKESDAINRKINQAKTSERITTDDIIRRIKKNVY